MLNLSLYDTEKKRIENSMNSHYDLYRPFGGESLTDNENRNEENDERIESGTDI